MDDSIRLNKEVINMKSYEFRRASKQEKFDALAAELIKASSLLKQINRENEVDDDALWDAIDNAQDLNKALAQIIGYQLIQ